MPSFDIVSKLNQAELDNAILQTQKEVGQRYDFKDTGTNIEKTEEGVVIRSNSEGRVEAALDVLQSKAVKRGIALRQLEAQDVLPAGGNTFRQVIKLVEGIDREKARKIIDATKETKLKVQAGIHQDTVRVTGKHKDDLQSVLRVLRSQDFGLELQFNNFRD